MTGLGLGIVGCGHVAEVAHLPALARVPEIEGVAVADEDRGRASRAASAVGGGASVHASADALVEDPRVEAVAVLVPLAGHLSVALAALGAGRHLLVEKPLTLTVEDAEALVDRAAEAGIVAMTGFN